MQLLEQTVLPDGIFGFLVVGEQLIDQLLVDCHGSSFPSSHGPLHSSIYTLGLDQEIKSPPGASSF